MKIKFTRAQVQEAVKVLSSHAPATAHTLEVLTHLHVSVSHDTMHLTSSDIHMELHVPVAVESDGVGAFTLPAKRFASLVGGIEKDQAITLEVDGLNTTMRSGRGRYQLAGLDPKSYPFIQFDPATKFSLPSDDLRAAFGYCLPAAAVKDIRYFLNGVFLDLTEPGRITFAATDGYRLATAHVALEHAGFTGGIILPREAVMLLSGILHAGKSADVEINEGTYRVYCGDYRLTGKKIDAVYPDWRRVLPTRSKQVSVQRRHLVDALKRLTLFGDKYEGMQITAIAGSMNMKTANAEAEETIDMEGEGSHAIPINIRYLMDAIIAGDGEHVWFSFGASNTDSFLVHEINENATVIMPMHI